jgi:hypothetical protein
MLFIFHSFVSTSLSPKMYSRLCEACIAFFEGKLSVYDVEAIADAGENFASAEEALQCICICMNRDLMGQQKCPIDMVLWIIDRAGLPMKEGDEEEYWAFFRTPADVIWCSYNPEHRVMAMTWLEFLVQIQPWIGKPSPLARFAIAQAIAFCDTPGMGAKVQALFPDIEPSKPAFPE